MAKQHYVGIVLARLNYNFEGIGTCGFTGERIFEYEPFLT